MSAWCGNDDCFDDDCRCAEPLPDAFIDFMVERQREIDAEAEGA